MKKLFVLFGIVLFIVSCRGPVGPEGPRGFGTNWKIIDLVASSNDWVENTDQSGLNRYYSSHFSMPEINSTVFNDGTVIAYLLTDNVQQTLPYVRHNENTSGDLWTQTIDFDFSVGNLNVYVTNSDFVVDPPATMNFRVVLMW
jgi:hypothetical protein